MPRFAAIDVGSNALRIRVVEVAAPAAIADGGDADRGWKEIFYQRAPIRLGAEVFSTGALPPKAIAQAVSALKEFRKQMDLVKVTGYRATGTSALREASNRTTLVERARREAGIDLEIIEGVEEARLIQLAVVRRVPLNGRRALLIDVGGGSTELTLLEDHQIVFSESVPIGTVRLLEFGDFRNPKSVRLLEEAIDRAFEGVLPRANGPTRWSGPPPQVLVGTGGNIETLTVLCPSEDGTRSVNLQAMGTLSKRLAKMTVEERAKTFALRPDRADTILPASAIFLRVAKGLGCKDIVVPGVGLKDGVLEDLLDRHFHISDGSGQLDSLVSACVRLGRHYQFDEAHGRKVASFADGLFRDLQDLHRLPPRDRMLLIAAAHLHDVGNFVRNEAHHKHSHYLILNSDVMGLSREERALVANIARYHRKSFPNKTHLHFRDLDPASRSKVRILASILRIADGLDREHLGKISKVSARVDGEQGRLVVSVTGGEEHELENWSVRVKSDLFREVFGLDVVVSELGV